jgi:hypothetical protein
MPMLLNHSHVLRSTEGTVSNSRVVRKPAGERIANRSREGGAQPPLGRSLAREYCSSCLYVSATSELQEPVFVEGAFELNPNARTAAPHNAGVQCRSSAPDCHLRVSAIGGASCSRAPRRESSLIRATCGRPFEWNSTTSNTWEVSYPDPGRYVDITTQGGAGRKSAVNPDGWTSAWDTHPISLFAIGAPGRRQSTQPRQWHR